MPKYCLPLLLKMEVIVKILRWFIFGFYKVDKTSQPGVPDGMFCEFLSLFHPSILQRDCRKPLERRNYCKKKVLIGWHLCLSHSNGPWMETSDSSCVSLLCWSKLPLKRVECKAKTCCPLRKTFSAILCYSLTVKMLLIKTPLAAASTLVSI